MSRASCSCISRAPSTTSSSWSSDVVSYPPRNILRSSSPIRLLFRTSADGGALSRGDAVSVAQYPARRRDRQRRNSGSPGSAARCASSASQAGRSRSPARRPPRRRSARRRSAPARARARRDPIVLADVELIAKARRDRRELDARLVGDVARSWLLRHALQRRWRSRPLSLPRDRSVRPPAVRLHGQHLPLADRRGRDGAPARDARGSSGEIAIDSAGTGGWHVGSAPDERATSRRRDARHHARAAPRARSARRTSSGSTCCCAPTATTCATCARSRRDAEARAKVRRLREFDPQARASGDLDIPDPYYGGARGFEDVLDLVERACRACSTTCERTVAV